MRLSEISHDMIVMYFGFFSLVITSLGFAFTVMRLMEIWLRKAEINDERVMRKYQEKFGIIKRSIWEKIRERMSQL